MFGLKVDVFLRFLMHKLGQRLCFCIFMIFMIKSRQQLNFYLCEVVLHISLFAREREARDKHPVIAAVI